MNFSPRIHPIVLAIAGCCALLSALSCTHEMKFTTPSGEEGYTIACRKPEKCFIRANDVCPSGYRILDANGRETDTPVMHGGRATHPEYVVNRQLKIACGH